MSVWSDAARIVAGNPLVRMVAADDAELVTDVVTDAFRYYPVPRYVMGDDSEESTVGMRHLIRFFVMARALRQEPIFGVDVDGQLTGVALVSNPSGPPVPEAFVALREQTWALLGPDVRRRYEAFGQATQRFSVDEPHLHLNMLAVRRAYHGRGFGRRLLEVVHALAEASSVFRGVTLTTEEPANVGLYQHFGYDVIGHERVGEGLETWGMYRRNP